jgi:hypothetical protein
MVDVRVAQNDVVNLFRFKTQFAVHGIGFQSFSLKHTAVEQYFLALFGGNEVFTSGNLTSGTYKSNFHKL